MRWVTKVSSVPVEQRMGKWLAVKFATLDVDAIFTNSHSKVLHGEYRPSLTATLATAPIARPLDTQVVVLSFGATIFTAWCSTGSRWAGGTTCAT